MMGLKDKFKAIFVKPKSEWEQQWQQLYPKQSLASRIPKLSLPELPTVKKVRIPGLRRVKRGLAALLLILNVMTALMTGGLGSIIFLSTAFILLDYLVKTKGANGWLR